MIDAELESWRGQWQSTSPVPSDLRARVERETRMMRFFLAAEVVVTAVIGGGSLIWALLTRRTDTLVLALGVWMFIGLAWTISFVLRRDTWAPAALSTTAFLDLSILRCRRRREALVAQSVLYVMILAFDLAWIYVVRSERAAASGLVSFLMDGSLAWVWLVTAALGGLAVRYRQKLSRELEALTRLRKDMG